MGYGTVDRKGVTGSISTLDQEDIENRSVTRVEELIEGNVAGVRVVRTAGGGFSILIRGVNSIHGSNEPLYVIDGLPIQVAPNEGIGWLNPNDIESITILKSASETAIYGVRGGNGVVVIRTKRP